jgi:hypothetical protein
MKLAKFKIDCTPPPNPEIVFSASKDKMKIRDPLFFRGLVIEDGQQRFVIASLDFCGLMNRAYDELVEALAETAGVTPDCVVVHCIHQHDTPLLNFELEEILDIKIFPEEWWQTMIKACQNALKESFENMIDVSGVGFAETRLYGYASNRRIPSPDGTITGMRFSRCGDMSLKHKPTGIIDPFLRTVAFKDKNENIITSMSFYATHPQVSNGRNLYSADAPGEAMRLTESKYKDSFPCFFTGAGGNVTAGKYSSPDDAEGNLLRFGKILAEGIEKNLKLMAWNRLLDLNMKHVKFEFPKAEIDTQKLRAIINNPETDPLEKRITAFVLSAYEYKKNKHYWLKLLEVGKVKILFMPGEPFVEYQLFVQNLIPDQFIALAANCSDNFLYLPLQKSFNENGYEENSFCWCTQAIENKLKNAINNIINS